MRAIVQDRYGHPEAVLKLADVDKPALADDAVLVRVRAASVNAGDWRRVLGEPLLVRFIEGIRRPKNRLVGGDAAGGVEAVGSAVTELKPGDEVFGMRRGAFAEYVSGKAFVRKPTNMSFEEAAAVPAAGCTALQAVRDKGAVQKGQHVLINGAGGGVGTFAVQIAKAFGAQVTAVTRTDCLEMVRSLGPDQILDYTREDFSRGGQRYDVIVDCGGSPSVATFRRALTPDGTLVLVAAGKGRLGVIGRLVGSQLRRRVLKQRVVNFIATGPFNENLETLRALVEAGKIRSVIDRTYPLSETPEALRYVATERARGKVVIRL